MIWAVSYFTVPLAFTLFGGCDEDMEAERVRPEPGLPDLCLAGDRRFLEFVGPAGRRDSRDAFPWSGDQEGDRDVPRRRREVVVFLGRWFPQGDHRPNSYPSP